PHTEEVSDMMDADDMETTTMDIEDNNYQQMPKNSFGSVGASEGVNHRKLLGYVYGERLERLRTSYCSVFPHMIYQSETEAHSPEAHRLRLLLVGPGNLTHFQHLRKTELRLHVTISTQ
ncbi:hypothetical protein Tco_1461003, partial [Tanacetum coccineum]